MAGTARVHVLADSPAKSAAVCAALHGKYDVTSELLGRPSAELSGYSAVIVKLDLRIVENVMALKRMLESQGDVPKRIFLLDAAVHRCIAQAYALGATLVLSGPVNQARLLRALADDEKPGASSPPHAKDGNSATSVGVAAITSMFAAVANGTPIDIKGTKNAGARIADQVADKGLCDWLATVRRHHEGTYQHCLLVTGVAVDFGLSLGLATRDLERLHSAAMFHDLGKATIPLAILDKLERLDEKERAIIETHPALGYDALKGQNDISAEVLDGVRHHHEYLDGSGYPDGLSGNNISDLVRILTISDIFSALIEDRRYRAPMPREDAYEVLLRMQGKLEKALVVSFKQVALNR
jgi:HD-GYP domain-containing protein (c-di-GMP phosphodiesterase class II)